jgi:hypothetical protein
MALSLARSGSFDPGTVTRPQVLSSSECGTSRAVRGRRFKYIDCGERQELFDLEGDPREERDVSTAHPDRCRTFDAHLERFDGQCRERASVAAANRCLATRSDL